MRVHLKMGLYDSYRAPRDAEGTTLARIFVSTAAEGGRNGKIHIVDMSDAAAAGDIENPACTYDVVRSPSLVFEIV